MIALEPYIGALKALLLISIAIALFAFGHHTGSQSVQSAWNKETAERKESENKAVFQAIKNNDRIAEQQEIDKQKLKKGYTNEISKINAAYAADRGLRINANVCAGFTATAKTEGTSGSNAATPRIELLPETYATNIKQLMKEADDLVAGYRAAQAFINDNGFAPQ